ncbi:hypothetical protein ES703_102531 [subsurface metagenome]
MYRHKLYLDTNILVAYYYKNDKRRNRILKFLKEVVKIKNVDLVLSDYTLTEFSKVFADIQSIKETEVWKVTSNLTHIKKIGREYPFEFLNVEGKLKSYDFTTFFVDVREVIMNCIKKPRIHLADAIHCAIMINNKTKYIVTTNKKDFGGVEKVTPFEPEEAVTFFKKKQK